jgi:hypothetical protein
MLPKSTNIHPKAPRDGRARRPCRIRQAHPDRPGRDTPEPPDEGASCGIHPITEPRTDWKAPIVPHVNLNPAHRRADSTGVAPHPQTAAEPLDLSGSGLRDERTPIERECMRIQQERIAVWRSGGIGAKVVELPRRSAENGWSYDRAA